MTAQIEYLDLDDLIYLAAELLGDNPPINDVGLLGSAAARPQTSVVGADAYPDVWQKAAALLHSLVKNHPLVDGNKRLGWLATATFLEINGVKVTAIPNDDVYDFVMSVASGQSEIGDLASELEDLVRKHSL